MACRCAVVHQIGIAADIGGHHRHPLAMASRMVLEMPSASDGSTKQFSCA
jgi:hypothetical protein